MPVSPTAARAVVRAANTAGKQVTVTLDAGGNLTGTARFREAGDPLSHTLLLFGAGTAGFTGLANTGPNCVIVDTGALASITQAAAAADNTLGTVIRAQRLTGMYQTSQVEYELGSGTPYRTADPTWTYGSGTE